MVVGYGKDLVHVMDMENLLFKRSLKQNFFLRMWLPGFFIMDQSLMD